MCVAVDVEAAETLARLLRAWLPGTVVEVTSLAHARLVPLGDGLILLLGDQARQAEEMVRGLRARGHEGFVVVVADEPDRAPSAVLAAHDVPPCVATHRLARDLVPALARVVAQRLAACSSPGGRQLFGQVGHLHALLAAGQLANRLPHRLNNPLAALVAEAQLLDLEPLSSEQHASVARIIELSRRLVDDVRTLEGLAPLERGT